MTLLRLAHISHRFGATLAVDDLSLDVRPGEIMCLVGPSGCGKSTLLRIAAGLEPLQAGSVELGGEIVADADIFVPPEARGAGLVFQDYALFPHLDVVSNVAFGLAGMPEAARRARALSWLDRVGLRDVAGAYPHMLSGGQQQRAALARALAPSPRVMLLDEPFSGLDARLRGRVRDQTLHVLGDSAATTLMVTHDPEEAMFMGERIAVMRAGRIEQVGEPAEIYFHPANAFVAGFFGEVNRIEARVHGGGITTPLGRFAADGLAEGAHAQVLIRSEAVLVAPDLAGPDIHAGVRGSVVAARFLGRTSLLHIVIGEGAEAIHLHARAPGRCLPERGEAIGVRIEASQSFVFPAAERT